MPTEQVKIISQYAPRILEAIEELLPAQPNEAEFRQVIDRLLSDFCREVGGTPQTRAEYTLAAGRADAIFNRFIVEYKRPGVLSHRLSDKSSRDALEQIKGYMEELASQQRRELPRMAGVVLDGHFLIFVRYMGGRWIEENPVEVNKHSLEQLLTWLSSLSSGIALSSENLNRDFAIEQRRTQNILHALFQGLHRTLEHPDGLVGKLFEQWRLFFSEAIDYSEAFGGRKLEPLKKWLRKAGFEIHSAEEAERFFFVLHTYFALLVKLLAWLALSRHLAVKLGAPSFAGLVTADAETLRRRLQEMESGGIFRDYGILNLLEGDFFAWYLHAWNDHIEQALRDIIRRLDEYDPTTLSLAPEETRDLFKKLYHYLLPREVRHNLGEYYTPDWLAQRLLVQLDSELFAGDVRRNETRMRQKLLNTRFLDPACGSGTFLVLVLGRMVELGRMLLVPESQLLESVLNNVVGFDLNPLAVLTARVNYLLAITDLLEHRRSEVTVPVYLADSVRTPALGEELHNAGTYEFPTAMGTFQVPAVLTSPGRFDRFCYLLEESVYASLQAEVFVRRCQSELNLDAHEWDERAVALTAELYKQMLELHQGGMNGLWARLLKNNFAPLTVGQFDYIVGNPPWVNWENLPNGYRQSIKPIWERYGLFPHGGMDTILGKGKKDISMLMTYTVMDGLLREGGRLGFVITQSLFKTSGAGQGFRRFRIPQGKEQFTPLAVVHVDDMVSLNPFEGASNRTAVMVLEKGKPTKYPVPYTVWRKKKGARFTYESTLEEVEAATRRLQFQAEPVAPTDPTAPWLTARPKALRAVRNILGRSDYEAHAGANSGGANAVYWLEEVKAKIPPQAGLIVVHNLTEGAKIKVEEVVEALEADLLYPLLRGRDVQRWRAEPSALILMVQDPVQRRGLDEQQLQMRYPRAYGYLKRFEQVLRDRAAFKRYFTRKKKQNNHEKIVETAPFYSMFNVAQYTFAPWKVVWREQASGMTASVVGRHKGKPTVPDHKLMLVDFSREREAHFVCACLNSSPGQFVAQSYAVEIQMDPHILEHIRIPHYDPKNRVHRRLAELSRAAHEAAKQADQQRLQEIEAEIDQQAARLWNITHGELREIQKSLRELAE